MTGVVTFEEFKELALNPPRRNEETLFEVIEYDVKDLPERKRSHYPKFDVRNYRVGIAHSLSEAEVLMHKAIERTKIYNDEIYCFHIKEYPVGELMSFHWSDHGVSWKLYDSKGQLLDKTYCSDLERDHGTKYGHYRGRPKESLRFREGEIIEVLDGDEVRLAVAAGSPLTIEWHWNLRERIKSKKGIIIDKGRDKAELTDDEIEKAYISDSGDDQIPVIDGPSYDTHNHIHTLNIMPLRYPLSKRLRKRYEGYYKAMLKEEGDYAKRQEADNPES